MMGMLTSILCCCCLQRKAPPQVSLTPESLPYAILEKSTPAPIQSAHRILFDEEFLIRLFGWFERTERTDRATCVSGALVCRAWTEHASRVFWEGPVDLLDLYGVLLQQPRRKGWRHDSGELTRYLTKVTLDQPHETPYLWSRFLICSSRILELETRWAGPPISVEVDLLKSFLRQNRNQTFLCALRSMTWHESPTVDGLLLSLAPPSLQRAQIFVHAASPRLGELLERLAPVSPVLNDLTLHVIHADSQPFTPACLLQHGQLRSLVLGKPEKIPVTPEVLHAILSHLSLESLSLGIEHFGGSRKPMRVSRNDCLRSLECD
ncbi:hypothetical protein BD311DRAFT_800843, partial [Dichomitus squalens]